MVQYIITPWRNHGELLHVRQQLYPDTRKPLNDPDRRQAVAQVSVWMQRGNCPHLVESTAILTSAILNDVPGNSTYCVRAAYSAAFCRFVTGLLDSHQDKRRKLSMYSLAKTIGLPATYVELRHQATHEELPSLSKLRTATQKALRWIWDYYWVQLSPENPPTDDCRMFVRRFVQEKNEETTRNMELSLENWDSDRVLEALAEIDDSVEDTQVLLRSIQLREKIINRGFSSDESLIDIKLEPTVSDLEEVKAELARMARALVGTENPSERENQVTGTVEEPSIKGWVLWEGPWAPKPIGLI